MDVAVHDSTGRELVVALFSVEALLDATVVFLALRIIFSVLKTYALFLVGRLLPVVAVIGIEMSFVKGKLRKENRMAGELVVIVQQTFRRAVNHKEYVQVGRVVGKRYGLWISGPKVVGSRRESVWHGGIAACGPIERCR